MKRFLLLAALAACQSSAPVSTAAGAPGAPTGLTVTAGNAENILAWSAAKGSTTYAIQRSSTKGGPYTTIGFTPGVTYTDSGLTNGTAYFYVVGGLNGTIASATSSEATAMPLASAGDAPPPVPTGLTATADAASANVALTWDASSGATGYVLFRAPTSGGPYTQLVASTTTTYSDKTVVTGTSYFYVARASAGSEQSADSSEATAKTAGVAPPPAPTGVTAISSSTAVSLSWNASAGATGYQVSRSTTSGGPYRSIATPTATSYTDKVAVGTYYYVVAATSGAATSVASSEIAATVSAPTSSGWLVGDGGLMLSLNTHGAVSPHAAVTAQSLNSLTCVGVHDAWAVGDGGVILYTRTGGAHWDTQTSSTTHTLRSVSFSSLTHGVIVGDSGTVLLTDDGGASWNAVALTGVAADLQAVKLSGANGVAVGGNGTILWTTTGGASWSAKASGLSATLRSVDVNAEGALAVGDNGTAVSITTAAVHVLSWNVSAPLFATRFLPDGSALAVGAGGTLVHGALSGAANALDSHTTHDLYALMIADPNYNGDSGILAAGASGTLLYAPTADADFTALASGTTASVRSIDDLPGN